MIFIELAPFVAFREEYWTDDDFRAMQNHLLIQPDAGDVMQGGRGLRKLRWSAQGKGKRGGARVIYYWQDAENRIYLVYGYAKNEQANLTPTQVKQLAELMKEKVQHG